MNLTSQTPNRLRVSEDEALLDFRERANTNTLTQHDRNKPHNDIALPGIASAAFTRSGAKHDDRDEQRVIQQPWQHSMRVTRPSSLTCASCSKLRGYSTVFVAPLVKTKCCLLAATFSHISPVWHRAYTIATCSPLRGNNLLYSGLSKVGYFEPGVTSESLSRSMGYDASFMSVDVLGVFRWMCATLSRSFQETITTTTTIQVATVQCVVQVVCSHIQSHP